MMVAHGLAGKKFFIGRPADVKTELAVRLEFLRVVKLIAGVIVWEGRIFDLIPGQIDRFVTIEVWLDVNQPSFGG